MSAMEIMFQRAIELVLSQLPPETKENVANLAKSGLQLKEQLDRMEQAQAVQTALGVELRTLFIALIERLPKQERNNGHAADEHAPGEQIRGARD